ncbi:MAG: hypothetical protein EAZ53_00455 [Bacteroidetes bacterium]|nr:MAG: hypothetical protein EAZ53_00455 [Bacteroidota bacterium]
MKIKNYLSFLAIALLCLVNEKSLAQTSIGVTSLSVCGNAFYNIPIVNPIKFTSYSMFLPNNTIPYAYAPAVARDANTLQDAKLMFNSSNIPTGITVATILGYRSDKVGKVPDNVISIDGFLSEDWRLDKNAYYNAKNSPSNVNFNTALYFNFKYDNNYVYFGGKVIDNTPAESGDKVEIYIDPYNWDVISSPNGDYLGNFPMSSDSVYIKAARQMVIPMLSQGSTVFRKNGSSQAAYSWPTNGTRDTIGIIVAVRTFTSESLPNYDDDNTNPIELKGSGYYFEVAVPFANFFGLNPNEKIDVSTLDGYSFGFNITSNDGTSDSQYFYNFNSDNGNSWNRTRPFGSATFSASDPQSASSFLGTVTIIGTVLPAVDASISSVGDCKSELTVSGIVTSIAGAESYWQTNANNTIGSDPITNSKVLTLPIPNKVFINTLYANGCWSKTTIIEVKPSTLNTVENKVNIAFPTCGFATFNASLVGIASRMYYWQTNNTITSSALTASNAYTISGSSLQSIYLRAQNTITGCWSDSLVTSATPNTTPPPAPDVTAGIDLLSSISGACVGKTALVYYTKSVSGNNLWYWQTDPLGTSTGFGNDTLLVTTSTAYLRNQLYGCWSDRSVGISVDLSDVVVPSPTTKNYTYFQNEATVPLALTSTNTLFGINWYVDSQTATPVQVAPTPTSTEIGTKNYFVSYTKGICESTKAPITVEIKELVVLIPKKYGMTPNGSGPAENEKFEIDNITSFAGNKVTITDKWGNIVFEKENYDNSFDGKRDGKDLPFGSYLYIVNLNNGKTPLTGTLVITR